MVLSGILVPVSLYTAGRKTTPSSGSPVVTKRHSAMTSLRASPAATSQPRQFAATIAVRVGD